MKNKSILLITLFTTVILILLLGCDEKVKMELSEDVYSNEQMTTRLSENPKWDYPVKPGTEKWKSLKTHSEKVLLCQIPDSVLKKCSTQTLLSLCLNYPLNFDFYAYSSLKEGVVKVSKEFNGLIELFNRDDNFYVLLKYINLALIQNDINSKIYTEEKGEVIYQYSLIECLLSFDECLNNSTKEELLLLKEEMAKILNYKISNPELFSVHSKGASLLLIANSLKKITPELNSLKKRKFL